MVALLDINDCNLQLWHDQTRVQSPGYALLEGREYRFGGPARAAARLRPRDISTRYWGQLSTQPLQPALGPARHSADLVHAHLLDLHREAGEPEELLLAVPGNMERDQLALLLGIIEQCPFRAVGLVNRSVALASTEPGGVPLYHLEIQLHQALLTRLEDDARERRAGRVQPLPGCGLLPLQERLAQVIASTFIRQTRFDPRRKAATEQALFDALPQTLARLRETGETSLEIAGYSARLHASTLEEAGQRLFERLHETLGNTPARLLADPPVALLPGSAAAFAGLNVLAPEQLAANLPALEDLLIQRDRPLALVTALPRAPDAEPAPAPAAPETTAAPRPSPPPAPSSLSPPPATAGATPASPTHLLEGFRARPLAAAGTELTGGWQLFRDGDAWLLRGPAGSPATVNGQPYSEGRRIHCGDTLAVAGMLAGVVIEVDASGT